jgi:ElaB/YqjD/DUF883 family membrane-anchored ribosome-binding protein
MTNTAQGTDRDGLVGQASAQVQEAASTAQEKTAELKEQGKRKLGETLEQRTNEAGVQAQNLARALRRSGEQLSNEGEGQQVAGLAQDAADRIERFGGYLERTSGSELVRDMEAFARRRPWIVAGIGLFAGLAASRFLKASSERRYEGSLPAAGSSSGYGYGSSTYSSANDRYADEPITRENFGVSG